jgi:hypothetical protein
LHDLNPRSGTTRERLRILECLRRTGKREIDRGAAGVQASLFPNENA